MRQILSLLLIFFFAISGCRDKVICPAFQSSYILDDSVRSVYYSYLWKLDNEERTKYLAGQRTTSGDTTEVLALGGPQTDYFAYVEPYVVPPNEVRKSKFGIVRYEPYWLKNYQLRTAPMENILAPPPVAIPDTSSVDIGEFVAADFTDSLGTDSLAVAINSESDTSDFVYPSLVIPPPPKPKKETVFLYKYDPEDEYLNVEQQYYNKHFGHLLYQTREVPAEQPLETKPAVSDSTSGSGGGWRGLFNKKGKQEPAIDELADEPVSPDEEVIDDN